MWSHRLAALSFCATALGCGQAGRPAGSALSLPDDRPDLTLQSVAFSRLSEGRVVARGTARSLDYRRQGGRLVATAASMTLAPGPGFAAFGELLVRAREVDGEVSGRRGTARGDVQLDAARGDRARTDRLDYDGATVHTATPVAAQGPGYDVHSGGLLARTDGSLVQLTGHVTGQLEAGALQ